MLDRNRPSLLSRRQFISAAAATGVAAATSHFPAPAIAQGRAPYTLMSLPYAENALEPVISARTMSFHYGRHHRGYVDTINRMVQGDPLGDLPLEELIKTTNANPNRAGQ